MNNLIPVSDAEMLKANDIHFAPGTLRNWHHLGKRPNVFQRIGGKLFIILSEWNKPPEARKAA